MRRNEFIKLCMTACSFAYFRPLFATARNPGLPNVLLIGDSISIGYTPFVQDILKDKANVFRPMQYDGKPENCSGTTKGVSEISRWLGTTKWDVIHFNFGLHDLKHVDPKTGEASTKAEDPLQAELKNYVKNLGYIVEQLKTSGAKLIFATTTPVPQNVTGIRREPENVVKYNKAALKIMKKENIEVNDLYSFTLPRLSEIQLERNVHFTEEGYEILAGAVTEKILRVLLSV